MHCSIIASLLALPPFLAASAVPAANAKAATESAVTSSAERGRVLRIFLSSLRCGCLDHERVRSLRTPHLVIRSAVVSGGRPTVGRPRGRVTRVRLVARVRGGRLLHLLQDLRKVVGLGS